MTCEELRGGYELHALRHLEEPEKIELEDHVHKGCGNCTSGIRRAFDQCVYPDARHQPAADTPEESLLRRSVRLGFTR